MGSQGSGVVVQWHAPPAGNASCCCLAVRPGEATAAAAAAAAAEQHLLPGTAGNTNPGKTQAKQGAPAPSSSALAASNCMCAALPARTSPRSAAAGGSKGAGGRGAGVGQAAHTRLLCTPIRAQQGRERRERKGGSGAPASAPEARSSTKTWLRSNSCSSSPSLSSCGGRGGTGEDQQGRRCGSDGGHQRHKSCRGRPEWRSLVPAGRHMRGGTGRRRRHSCLAPQSGRRLTCTPPASRCSSCARIRLPQPGGQGRGEGAGPSKGFCWARPWASLAAVHLPCLVPCSSQTQAAW